MEKNKIIHAFYTPVVSPEGNPRNILYALDSNGNLWWKNETPDSSTWQLEEPLPVMK